MTTRIRPLTPSDYSAGPPRQPPYGGGHPGERQHGQPGKEGADAAYGRLEGGRADDEQGDRKAIGEQHRGEARVRAGDREPRPQGGGDDRPDERAEREDETAEQVQSGALRDGRRNE